MRLPRTLLTTRTAVKMKPARKVRVAALIFPQPSTPLSRGDDEPRGLEAQGCDEEADPAGKAVAEHRWYPLQDQLSPVEEGQEEEDHPCPEDAAEGRLPGDGLYLHHGVGEEVVDAHPRSHHNRIFGVDPHQDAGEGADDDGGGQDGAVREPRLREDGGVHEDYVHRREEGGGPRQSLGLDLGPVVVEVEDPGDLRRQVQSHPSYRSLPI